MKPLDLSGLLERCTTRARTPSTGVSMTWRGLNYGYLPSQCGSPINELANGLRLDTAVLSQDLSGVWTTVRG
jgi:hypothetical protein